MANTTSFRNARKSFYTRVSNHLLNDKNVTLQAKGLLMIFLSNTDDWEIQMKEIITRSKNGRDAHYTVLKELIAQGYVARIEYKNAETKRYIKQEYIFSDVQKDVEETLKEIEKSATENHMIIEFTYKVTADKTEKKSQTNKKKKDGQNPFTDFPDVGLSDSESQYINNNKENKTNNNKTNNNLNNLYYLNKENKTLYKQSSHAGHTSNASKRIEKMSKDQYQKEFSFNKYPKLIALELSKVDYQDAKTLMDITNKAKRAVSKEYDDMKRRPIDFTYETHEVEISQILNRMLLKAKFDNVSIDYLSRYISRSIQNYYRDYANEELEAMIQQDMLDASHNIRL